MISILTILQSLGWALYAGPMIAFAIMIHTKKPTIPIFQLWGVGFGLSLALWIYTTIALQYAAEATFLIDIRSNIWILAAFIMWVSNVKLEIWTLDPIRKKNTKTIVQLQQAERTLKIHLSIHALLVVLVHVLFSFKNSFGA